MSKYIFKRILMLIPVIIGVSLLVFIMLDLAPGTVLDMIATDYTPEQLAELEHELGFSLFVRSSRTVRLTDSGQEILNLFRSVDLSLNNIRANARKNEKIFFTK